MSIFDLSFLIFQEYLFSNKNKHCVHNAKPFFFKARLLMCHSETCTCLLVQITLMFPKLIRIMK